MDTKSLEQTKKAWNDAIGRVPQAYQDGVKNAKDVIAKGVAAEALYAQKLQETIASGKRARELAKVTDESWKKAAGELGGQRIGPGMNAHKEDFGTGISAVLDVLQGIQLPARTADPAQNVANRVLPIALKLHELKK